MPSDKLDQAIQAGLEQGIADVKGLVNYVSAWAKRTGKPSYQNGRQAPAFDPALMASEVY